MVLNPPGLWSYIWPAYGLKYVRLMLLYYIYMIYTHTHDNHHTHTHNASHSSQSLHSCYTHHAPHTFICDRCIAGTAIKSLCFWRQAYKAVAQFWFPHEQQITLNENKKTHRRKVPATAWGKKNTSPRPLWCWCMVGGPRFMKPLFCSIKSWCYAIVHCVVWNSS